MLPAACTTRASSPWLLLAAALLLAHGVSRAAGAGEQQHYLPPVPLDEEKMRTCGDPRWRAWYAELSWRMREGRTQPRYLINSHSHTGLSDRLVSGLIILGSMLARSTLPCLPFAMHVPPLLSCLPHGVLSSSCMQAQVNTMSAFWMAVASERAFEVYSYPGTHGLEVAYDWNYINASVRQDYPGWDGARSHSRTLHRLLLPSVVPGCSRPRHSCMLAAPGAITALCMRRF